MEFDSVATRWLRERDHSISDEAPFNVDENGFLVDPTEDDTAASSRLVRPPSQFRNEALVILGEPGSGKSTTFRHILDVTTSDDSKVFEIDASEVTERIEFNETLGRLFSQLPDADSDEQESSEITIVIDQLDESSFISRFSGAVKSSLLSRSTKSLRLFIGCRTADLPTGLTDALRSSFTHVLLCDLAPLTRDDAVSLASSKGIDGQHFVSEVVRSSVGPLASIPLTLQLLVSYYIDHNGLGLSPNQLFYQSSLRLSDEHDRTRTGRDSESTPAQRLAVAERIAARMLLCGQRSISTEEAALVKSGDVTEQSLAGGFEHVLGEEFYVSPRIVSECLGTALFSRSPGRVRFIHSSLAAFLCARFLSTRTATRLHGNIQLRNLFLDAAPDEESASIPIHLRETAAWLIEQQGQTAEWLATADPDGLMAHCAYVTSDQTKERIIDSLLKRAAEVELTNRGWQPVRWKVWHSGLDTQLERALSEIDVTQLQNWDEFARARLVINLARDCAAQDAIPSLLAVSANALWPSPLRRRAARAAMEVDPERAGPQLKKVLRSLDSSLPSDEETEELVGTIIDLIWPSHATLADVLFHVHEIRRESISGFYRWVMLQFPYSAQEQDLAELASFSLARFESSSDFSDDLVISDDDPSADTSGRIPSGTVTAIIDRLLSSSDWPTYLSAAAQLIARRIHRRGELTVPAPVADADRASTESDPAQNLRLRLLDAVVRELLVIDQEFSPVTAYYLTSVWKETSSASLRRFRSGGVPGERRTIVDSADLAWIFEKIDHHNSKGDEGLSRAYGIIAGRVVDLYDRDTFDLVYARRNSSDWPQYRNFYDGIAIDGQIAQSMRLNHRSDQSWTQAGVYAQAQNRDLALAVDGNTLAFWRLVQNLAFDPQTGRPEYKIVDDIRQLPGVSLWGQEDFSRQILIAAEHYLSVEHDHRLEWLGLAVHDFRAGAGMQAILLAARMGRLDLIGQVKWDRWLGALVDHISSKTSFLEGGSDLRVLEAASKSAEREFCSAVEQLVRTSCARGWSVPGIELLTASNSRLLAATLLSLAREVKDAIASQTVRARRKSSRKPSIITSAGWRLPSTPESRSAAVSTWTNLVSAATLVDRTGAIESAHSIIVLRRNSKIRNALGAAAARCILRSGDPIEWSRLYPEVSQDPKLSNSIGDVLTAHDLASMLLEMTEQQLLSLYQWLATEVPPHTEVHPTGIGSPLPKHALHDARNFVLRQIVERGTTAAVLAVRALSEQHHEDLRIRSSLIEARRNAQAKAAVVPSPDQVVLLLADPRRRVVQTSAQLAEVIVEVLAEVVGDLPTHANLLWDSERQARAPEAPPNTRRPTLWRPKLEGSFVMYLRNQLALRLASSGVIINREVLINPTDEGDSGERADLLVQAVPVSSRYGSIAQEVVVPIEVKGSWHPAVSSAQRSQLAERYLPPLQTDSGVYIVGWFDLEAWDCSDDYRRSAAIAHRSANHLEKQLRIQANAILADLGVRTFPVVVPVSRATKAQQ